MWLINKILGKTPDEPAAEPEMVAREPSERGALMDLLTDAVDDFSSKAGESMLAARDSVGMTMGAIAGVMGLAKSNLNSLNIEPGTDVQPTMASGVPETTISNDQAISMAYQSFNELSTDAMAAVNGIKSSLMASIGSGDMQPANLESTGQLISNITDTISAATSLSR